MSEEPLSPAIDIVCPAWNRSAAIRPTIDSVLGQTFPDWRLLVVSDGSTDDTDEVVRSYQDPRIQLIRIGHTGHPGAPRNAGLAAATAPAIAYLDSDDRWLPEHLEALQRGFAAGARLVVTASIGMNHEGEQYRSDLLNAVWHPDLQLLWALFEPSRVGHLRGLPESVGGWTTDQAGMEDWDLWLRLSDAGERFTPLPERTVLMYLSDSSRRRTMTVRHEVRLGTLPDEESCTQLSEQVRSVGIQDELRATFATEMLRFYRDKAAAGELVIQAGVRAEAVLERVEEYVTDSSVPMLRELSHRPLPGGGFAVLLPLQCSSDRHAVRLREFLAANDGGRHAVVRRLIGELGGEPAPALREERKALL